MTENKTPEFCVYDGSDYQEEFWDNANRAYEDGSEAIAFEKLLPKSGKRMLEIGAGAGRNTPRYEGYEKIYLFDYALTQMQQAKQRLGASDRLVFAAADVYHLPYNDNVFDGATMIRVIHHLSEIDPAMAEIQRVMEKDSTFILEYANKRNMKAILRWATRRQKWNPFTKEQVEFVKLNYDNHPDTIKETLESHGFEIERALSVSNLRIGALKNNPNNLDWMLRAENKLQDALSGVKLSPSIFLKCRQTGGESYDPNAPIFRCPACGSIRLEESKEAVTCPDCGRVYPIVDGIYNFRLE